jgi:putative endonuclease
MAAVYILFSNRLNKYYIGSCLILEERIAEHKQKAYTNSYTAKSDDWELFYFIDNLEYEQARRIEKHIKQMKSRKYIENLKCYQEISSRLKDRYQK